MVFVWYWMVVLDIVWNCIAFYITVLYGMVINGSSVDVIESVSCTTIISNVRVLESHLGFTDFSLIHWLHFNSSSNDNLPHGRLHKLIWYWRKVMRLRSRQGRKLTWVQIRHYSWLRGGWFNDCESFLVLSHCLHLKVMILKTLKVMILFGRLR